jgi:putative CocE/NonD family hydrolase
MAAAEVAKDDGDTACEKIVADNIAKLKRPDLDWLQWLGSDSYYDALYAQRSAMFVTGYIDIPTLGTQAWQDEQVGARMGYYEDTISPEKMWLISSNGNHETSYISDDVFAVQKRFYAHFLKGEDNGFEREAHVRLLQEMQTPQDPKAKLAVVPTAVAEFDRLPVKVTPMRLALQAGGKLGADEPANAQTPSSSYRYPVDGPAVNNPEAEGWKAVTAADGQLTFTTAALPQDLSYYGEGSVDLWLSSTDSDTDVQVTLSEVRPDGMEMFVQRGWLRASKRQLDESRSSVLRPWGDFTEAAVKMLVPNEPALLRVELQKFAHVFRAGSSIRVTVDTPSQTGYWVFGIHKTPSTNMIWHDTNRSSSIVLGYLPYAHNPTTPSCETTLRQPCRKNAVAVPAGTGPRAPG